MATSEITEHDVKLVLDQVPFGNSRGKAIMALQACEGNVVDAVLLLVHETQSDLVRREAVVLDMCPPNTPVSRVTELLDSRKKGWGLLDSKEKAINNDMDIVVEICEEYLVQRLLVSRKLAHHALMACRLSYQDAEWFIKGFIWRGGLSKTYIQNLE